MKTTVRIAAVATVAAMALTGAATASATDRRPGVQARVWVTTVDRSELMAERARCRSARARRRRRRSWWTRAARTRAWTGSARRSPTRRPPCSTAEPAGREQAMRGLFDPAGIGVSFLRQPIGSSDFTAAAAHYTYDDMPAGQTDFGLAKFSVAHDEAQVLPLLRRATPAQPAVEDHGDAVEPAGLDEDHRLPGRRTAQRRPRRRTTRTPATWSSSCTRTRRPACRSTTCRCRTSRRTATPAATRAPTCRSRQEAKVIEVLGPLLRPRARAPRSSPTTTTGPPTPTTSRPPRPARTRRPTTRTSCWPSPAAKWIAGTAYHCYYGDPSAQTALHNAYPNKGIWFTECSGSHGPNDPPASSSATR